MKKHIASILKFAAAAVIITLLIRSGKLDFRQLPQAFAHPAPMLIAFLIIFCEVILCAFRWQMLLRGVGVRERMWNIFQFTWIGLFFNNVMLGSVGGDLIKVVYVVRHFPEKKALTGMSVFIDRLVGLYAMMLWAVIGLLLLPHDVFIRPPMQVMFSGLLMGIGAPLVALPIIFSERFRKLIPQKGKMGDLVESVLAYRKAKRYLVYGVGMSMLNHIGLISAYYFLTVALSGEGMLSLAQLLAIVPLGMMTLAIPIAPAGLGVGQAAFSQLFQWAGIPDATLGANAVTLWQVLNLMVNLLGAFSFFQYRRESTAVAL
jgi:uncharacterized protein (TIRG00374 family)